MPEGKSEARIGFVGDVAPTGSVRYRIEPSITAGAALVCANLEAPITRGEDRLPKAGPTMRSDGTVDYGGARFCFSLANNHIMDHGERGLNDTLTYCRGLEISVVGAGANLSRAREALTLQVGDCRVGILARCETQFGVATARSAGVAPLDATIHRTVRELRGEVDRVIVSLHGAAELSPWPAPAWQDLLRSLVEDGADLVLGHHAHVPQGFEQYESGVIFYGLGNFLVDPDRWTEDPNTRWSLSGSYRLEGDGPRHAIRTSVVERGGDGVVVRPSRDDESTRHHEYLEKCNSPLGDRELLNSLWQEVSLRLYDRWYASWLGFDGNPRKRNRSRLVRWLRSRSPAARARDARRARKESLLHYHLFACESHRLAISTALGVLGGELADQRDDRSRALADELLPWSIDR